jgi:hypothetical protein
VEAVIIQAYDDSSGKVSVFSDEKLLFSFNIFPPLKNFKEKKWGRIDAHLKLIRLKRRGKWEDTSWGSQAEVRWRP